MLKVDVTEIVRNAEINLNTIIQVYAHNNTKSVSAVKTSVVLGTPVYQNAFRFLFIRLSWIKPFGTSSVYASNTVRAVVTVLHVA
jgi:hypothetical protein